jgi:pantoate--beta-alanine ligase
VKAVRTVAELRAELRPARREERVIGLVPTMGALHEGHLSLVHHARATCDVVVVSLFVNPAQFNVASDLAAYPRDEERDAALAAEAGADLLFAPELDEVYPPGFATTVHVSGLTETLEGEHRGVDHFDGVTTVVTKLLNMVGPDVAFFGQKDAQQALVIRTLVRDLDLPVRIEVRPTVREPDGLALSSRNVHLRGADRQRALALRDALAAAEASLGAGPTPTCCAPPRWPPCAGTASSPTTSSSSVPTTSPPSRASTARSSSPSPPAWAPPVSSTTRSSMPMDSREAELQ